MDTITKFLASFIIGCLVIPNPGVAFTLALLLVLLT